MFDSYKTTKYYVDYIEGCNEEQRDILSKEVKDFFFRKVESEMELDIYKITLKELEEIIETFEQHQ